MNTASKQILKQATEGVQNVQNIQKMSQCNTVNRRIKHIFSFNVRALF